MILALCSALPALKNNDTKHPSYCLIARLSKMSIFASIVKDTKTKGLETMQTNWGRFENNNNTTRFLKDDMLSYNSSLIICSCSKGVVFAFTNFQNLAIIT